MSDSKKYEAAGAEQKWAQHWEVSGTYRYNPDLDRDRTFVVDTPPPTVSGSLHVGHVFSYTQTDIIVRYKRMCGLNIYYPMGWDDNGLPTERRIQKLFNITCDPLTADTENIDIQSLESSDKRTAVSRKNFIDLCEKQTKKDEQKYEALWRRLGLSIDWSQQYATIDQRSQKISQMSFLDLVQKGFAYNKFEPTSWDVDFQTAIAQAEMEDRDRESFLHKIVFKIKETGESFEIATTRPELLPACIAIVANPQDERYKKFFGLHAISPLFSMEIPFLPAAHAVPEKGTGALMICTFGDAEDLQFWRASGLPLRQILNKQGRFIKISFSEKPFQSLSARSANEYYQSLIGLTVPNARKEILGLLSTAGFLSGEPQKILQTIKYYEKGDKPLELIPVRQWFIHLMAHKDAFLEQGRKIHWHPQNMRHRYEQWVEALNQDWSISRQRYFGVPLPVWYKLDAQGMPDYKNPLFPSKDQLPLDPLSDCPIGFDEELRNKPGGFMGDPDVMDTWATSSLTPLINSHWGQDLARHKRLFPADLRSQAHEIIRTWAFYTIVKSWMHEREIPWKDIAISGWVVDPNKNKMSKSKGNTIEPEGLIATYSADSVRYWAAKARLGSDTTFDEGLFKIGRKLETKLLNAARFVYHFSYASEALSDLKLETIDLGWLGELSDTVKQATEQFEAFNYASALELIEKTFWQFCDDYLETVKARAYRESTEQFSFSAVGTLRFSMNIFIRLLAPFMPYVTEEIWSYEKHQTTSIHKSNWPNPAEFPSFSAESSKSWDLCRKLIQEMRQQRASNKMGVGHSLETLSIWASAENIFLIQKFQSDLINVSRVIPNGLMLSEILPANGSEDTVKVSIQGTVGPMTEN